MTFHFAVWEILTVQFHADNGDMMQIALTMVTSQPTVPYVFIKGNFIGGADGRFTYTSAMKRWQVLLVNRLLLGTPSKATVDMPSEPF